MHEGTCKGGGAREHWRAVVQEVATVKPVVLWPPLPCTTHRVVKDHQSHGFQAMGGANHRALSLLPSRPRQRLTHAGGDVLMNMT